MDTGHHPAYACGDNGSRPWCGLTDQAKGNFPSPSLWLAMGRAHGIGCGAVFWHTTQGIELDSFAFGFHARHAHRRCSQREKPQSDAAPIHHERHLPRGLGRYWVIYASSNKAYWERPLWINVICSVDRVLQNRESRFLPTHPLPRPQGPRSAGSHRGNRQQAR